MDEINTSISSFAEIRRNGCVYVDKTQLIYDLFVSRPGHYFLSRPRRFGKSLLINTLEAIFTGRRDLFEGLDISRCPYEWPTCPVLHFDFGNFERMSGAQLRAALNRKIDLQALELGIENLDAPEPALRLEELVYRVRSRVGKRVVLLVDEYDKPVLEALGTAVLPEVVDEMRNFYSTIKTAAEKIRFSLMTGVSRFSKVSIFSGINNLQDLSMDPRAKDLLGYTKDELLNYFPEQIEVLRYKQGLSSEAVVDALVKWYDGYRFHQDSEGVFNPVSIGECLTKHEFRNYWFETGTPRFLLDILQKAEVAFDCLEATPSTFESFDPVQPNALAVLFQTGYLSIKDVSYDADRAISYVLAFPNLEVKSSLSKAIVWDFSRVAGDAEKSRISRELHAALADGDVDLFVAALKTLFANVPNNLAIQKERYYQTLVLMAMLMLDVTVVTEGCTNVGRIDMVIKTAARIIIVEFKLDGDAKAAMDQIKRKRYAEKYACEDREIVLVGISFGVESRNINEHLVEVL